MVCCFPSTQVEFLAMQANWTKKLFKDWMKHIHAKIIKHKILEISLQTVFESINHLSPKKSLIEENIYSCLWIKI